MALPHAPEARPFYRSARQRSEDAEFLLDAGRTTGAVYLAGYGVECMLKSLILAVVPAGGRGAVLQSFRGAKAHDFDWLKDLYFRHGGPPFPSAISRSFALVNSWSTDLRYEAGSVKPSEARAFLESARAILSWADGRL